MPLLQVGEGSMGDLGGGTMTMAKNKFMMSLGADMMAAVQGEADSRSVTLQEFIRVVIIPEWFEANGRLVSVKDKLWAELPGNRWRDSHLRH